MSECSTRKAPTINRVSNCKLSIHAHDSTSKTSGNASKPKGILLMNQNVQCLRNKVYEIEIMLNDELQNVDVLCLTEHWLNESEIHSYNIQNFKLCSIVAMSTEMEAQQYF